MGDIFGGLFDFDLDGKTDAFEFALGMNMVFEDEKRSERARQQRCTIDDDDEDEMLELNGLDRLDFELMDADKHREALEDAVLDPDDFD